MRGRQSAAMLELIGVSEPIARDRADYLGIARRLVADVAWRHELAARIRDGHGQLFDAHGAIESLHILLQTGVAPA
jgi:predicted O-linked N-acetylglucosamine transferase (SPINDLY family)